MRLHSPQWVAIAATLMVVGGSVTAGVLHLRDDSGEPSSTELPVAPGLEEAQAVAAALRDLSSKPENLVASDVQSALAGKAREAVPADATITPHEASWFPDGIGGGTMTVTISASGKPTTTYSAIMVKERTGWKVVGTMPMAPAAPAAPAPAAPAPAGQAPAGQAPAGQGAGR